MIEGVRTCGGRGESGFREGGVASGSEEVAGGDEGGMDCECDSVVRISEGRP